MRAIACSAILFLFVWFCTMIPASSNCVIETTHAMKHEFLADKLDGINRSTNISDCIRLTCEGTESEADNALQNSSTIQTFPSSCEKCSDQRGRPLSLQITEPHPLPAPFPDGRIFTSYLPTEDAIPYIPTENPKINAGIPIATSEPD